MPTLPARAAAYTRTGILRKFLDQLADTLPARVDNGYAELRLGLKGGDVRAFLQSLRVLGLTDPYGHLTDRARRTRGATQRAEAMREGLEEAYPELFWRWEARNGMSREEVEDFFKVEYGLSTSSAGPAAKLFIDLMREYRRPEEPNRGTDPYGRPLVSFPERGSVSLPESSPYSVPLPERLSGTGSETGLVSSPERRRGGYGAPAGYAEPVRASEERGGASGGGAADVRLAALEMVKASLHIDINAEWDPERIQLVFDRMERLVERILGGSSAA